MASNKARKPNRPEKKLTRSYFKKQQLPQHNNNKTSTTLHQPCSSSTTSVCPQDTNYSVPSPSPAVLTSQGGDGGCCTPKAKKFMLPEILTCPPAPKKQRVDQNCVLRRRHIVFFASPEIELFFAKAHENEQLFN